MRARALALASLVVAIAGCRLPQVKSEATVTQQQLPTTVPDLIKYADGEFTKQDDVDVENALMALDKAHTLDPKNYEAAWKAARAATWLADDLYDDKNKRAHYAGVGIDYAKAAIADNPGGVEGYYYLAATIGLSATTKTIGGKFDVPKVRDAAKKAEAIDPKFEYGGPDRVLGGLYTKAPPWPASIGDTDKGVEYMQKAVQLAPDYPQNWLFLGDALAANGEGTKAIEQYHKVINAPADPRWEHALPKWKRLAQLGIENVTRKQSYGSE